MIEAVTQSHAQPLLAVENLSITYGTGAGRKIAVDDISFTVGRGEAIGIVGESGSGKTTLAKAILGVAEPSSGRIVFDGKSISGHNGAEQRRFRRSGAVQYVFQDPLGSLDPQWTIFRSIEEPLILGGNLTNVERREAVFAAAESVKLERSMLERKPSQLSGGQRQRAAIARAITRSPKLLIADEPVSALDSATRVHILELFSDLRRKTGIAQVFISHDLGSVAFLVDRILVMSSGRIVESGTTKSVLRSPRHDYTRELLAAVPRLRT